MNFEYLLWIIRQINIIVHAIAGLICVGTFIYNLFSKKGSKHHIKAGKIFGVGTMFLVGTSLVSFLILRMFPFFLMAYMAYYLFYSSIVVEIKNKLIFWSHYALAIFTALFYLTGGKIGGYYGSGYAYLHWGIVFSIFIIWDFYRLFIQKRFGKSHFLFVHSNRLILSFFFVFTAFMVSQFSHKAPQMVNLLCFYIPVISIGILLITNNILIISNKTPNA